MSIAVSVIRKTTDAEMQTPPDRCCRNEFACIPLPERFRTLAHSRHDTHYSSRVYLAFLWPHLRRTGALLYSASLGGFVALLGVPIIVLGESTPVWRCTGMYFTMIFILLAHGPAHIWCYCIYHATDWDSVFGIYASRLF